MALEGKGVGGKIRTHLTDYSGFDSSASRSKIAIERLRLYLVLVGIELDPHAERFAVRRFLP